MSNTTETWVNGITREDVREFTERAEPKAVTLDLINSEYGDDKTRTLGLINKLDGLLQLFDINPSAWQQNIQKSGNDKKYSRGLDNLADVKRWARGHALGAYLYERAWQAVPIEMGEEDYERGHYMLGLRLDDDCGVTLRASGTHSVSRVYVKPGTYERVEGDLDELEEKAVNGELDTDIVAVYTRIGFVAVFGKPEEV
jgi:hypothetical protein